MSIGSGNQGGKDPWILKYLAKCCFPSFERKN